VGAARGDDAASNPVVSVIVPVRDDPRLAACLDALATQDYPREAVEVLVVDNGSSPPVHDLAIRYPDVRFLDEAESGSYAARNRGLAAARGEVLAFTDSDCRPAPDWLSTAVACLTAPGGPDLLGGRVRVTARDPGAPNGVELYEMLHAFPQQRYVEQFGFAVTANLVTTRQIVDAVGPFDATLLSGGDKEFGRRVRAAGHRLAYVEGAVVEHPARSTWGAYRRKLERVLDGELAARAAHGADRGSVGAVTWRSVTPPVSAIRRAWSDPRLPTRRARLRYAGAAVTARYVGLLVRVRSQRSRPAGR
jgi:cellulose synthase/poly-beta-1,6-N-acetylglucosamine synthase-like glycosyltransferase